MKSSRENERELRNQCAELIQEKQELEEKLQSQSTLNQKLAKGLQAQIEEKYAAHILFNLVAPEDDNTITLDGEDISNLYEICVKAVQKTNDQLDNPLYKEILAEYLTKDTKEQKGETKDEEENEDEDKEDDSGDGSNDEKPDDDDGHSSDKGKPDNQSDDEEEDDDDDLPPESKKFTREERRIKCSNEKSDAGSSKRQQGEDKHSPSFHDALTQNFEHQDYLNTAEKVQLKHQTHIWKTLALR